jgi:hypothetical protein
MDKEKLGRLIYTSKVLPTCPKIDVEQDRE